jgi:UDP-GlcNAc:undecaprenyl-phosphate GlcNAc-1-phosphate transferase
MFAQPPLAPTDVLREYLWPFAIALIVTMTIMPVVRSIAIAGRVFDVPDSGLKPHERPIPYLGGLGIYIGWAAALGWAAAAFPASRHMLLMILAAGTVMMLTGLIDDIRDLRPRTKLLLELVAAGLLLAAGVGTQIADIFFSFLGIDAPPPVVWTASAVITVFILLGAGNATNLIDGLDGLCAGVIGIISVGFLIIATHLAAWRSSPTWDPVRMTLAVALFGACLAFLRYNFNPAQVFMGDAGSLLLGFNAAALILLFAERHKARWFVGALMVFALPVFDTALAILRRWLNRRPLFTGDRSHFYDQLRQRGFSVRQTVLISYGLAFFYAAVGCLVLYVQGRWAAMIFVIVALVSLLAVIHQRMLRREPPADAS